MPYGHASPGASARPARGDTHRGADRGRVEAPSSERRRCSRPRAGTAVASMGTGRRRRRRVGRDRRRCVRRAPRRARRGLLEPAAACPTIASACSARSGLDTQRPRRCRGSAGCASYASADSPAAVRVAVAAAGRSRLRRSLQDVQQGGDARSPFAGLRFARRRHGPPSPSCERPPAPPRCTSRSRPRRTALFGTPQVLDWRRLIRRRRCPRAGPRRGTLHAVWSERDYERASTAGAALAARVLVAEATAGDRLGGPGRDGCPIRRSPPVSTSTLSAASSSPTRRGEPGSPRGRTAPPKLQATQNRVGGLHSVRAGGDWLRAGRARGAAEVRAQRQPGDPTTLGDASVVWCAVCRTSKRRPSPPSGR